MIERRQLKQKPGRIYTHKIILIILQGCYVKSMTYKNPVVAFRNKTNEKKGNSTNRWANGTRDESEPPTSD